jgi:hypothetical protein
MMSSYSAWGTHRSAARRYLTRPKLDILNMPGENKGIFGFNLIWQFGTPLTHRILYEGLCVDDRTT